MHSYGVVTGSKWEQLLTLNFSLWGKFFGSFFQNIENLRLKMVYFEK